MKRVFLITGFPRSRTGWLSVFLSSGDTLCLHEPISQFNGQFVPMVEYLATIPSPNLGISDSGIAEKAGLYSMTFPSASVMVIERSKEDSFRSHRAYYGSLYSEETTQKAFDVRERGLQSLDQEFQNVKRIPFASLETVEGARVAWEFCCPGKPFDQHRYQAMNRIVCNPKL